MSALDAIISSVRRITPKRLNGGRQESLPNQAQDMAIKSIAVQSHLPALDGVRAVAAFTVIAFHAGYDPKADGVTAFFVLSGFLITTLLLREQQKFGSVSLRNFYLRRTLRIFPAYYCFVAFSCVIDYVTGFGWTYGLFWSAVGYVINYYNAAMGHPSVSVAHAWSLGIEEQFYILWPVGFILLARRGTFAMQVTLAGLILGSVGWRIFLHVFFGVSRSYLYNAFDARFDNLLIGCLLAVCVRQEWFQTLAKLITKRSWFPLLTIGGTLLVQIGFGTRIERHLLGFTLYSALVAVLLTQLLVLHKHLPWRWLDSRPMQYLGNISYPTYLYHVKALGLAGHLAAGSSLLRFLVGVVITYLVASVSYFAIELPFLALKKRFAPASVAAPKDDRKRV